MGPREQEEYRALRATIRERGTARVWVFLIGIAAWAALTIAIVALASPPVATVIPLLVLTAAFEGVFALHVGVERVGRYIQVYVEEGPEGWEHAAMAFGRPRGTATTDALFIVPFVLAALFNVAPALIAQPAGSELVFVGGTHALFALRLFVARAAASRQRAIDLARFQELRKQDLH